MDLPALAVSVGGPEDLPDFAVGLLFLLLLDLEVLCKDIAADLPDLAAVSLSAGQGNGQSSELELLIRGADTELLLDLEAAVPSALDTVGDSVGTIMLSTESDPKSRNVSLESTFKSVQPPSTLKAAEMP